MRRNTINKKKSKRYHATVEVTSSHIVHRQSNDLDQKVVREIMSIKLKLCYLRKQLSVFIL